MQINGRIGGKSIFGNIFVELILALICAILPPNVMIVLAFVASTLCSLRPYQSHRWQSEEAFCWQYCFYILHLHRDRHGHATDNPRTFLPCPVYRTD